MIIEIRDLPSDRKVKHITFDITFEDGEPVVKTTPYNPAPPGTPIFPHQNDPFGPPYTVTCDTTTAFATTPVVRKQKDIPPEMKDMEF